MAISSQIKKSKRCSTGIPELDGILDGGLPCNRIYLIQGDPGVGKTTTALQFLLKGREVGEQVMYVTLSETKDELIEICDSHGWSLEGISLMDLSVLRENLGSEMDNTLFHPSEVELKQTMSILFSEIQKVNPTRFALDSLSEIRLLSQNDLRFRRQILDLKEFFANRQCTVILLDESSPEYIDLQIQSIVHGVIKLSNLPPEYGAERRRMMVTKMRGVKFRGGFHDFAIRTGGIEVFPRLIAAEHRTGFQHNVLSSGIHEIDELLQGGIDSGTSTLILGPAGTGKSSLTMQFVHAAATRGEKAFLYLFDETLDLYLSRSKALNLDLTPFVELGLIGLFHVDPAEFAPGELTYHMQKAVDEEGVRLVVIDSLNGYINAMPGERYLNLQLHETLTYLDQNGVATFLVLAQHGLLGSMESAADLTYLADTVLVLRHFEAFGEVQQAIFVIKKRSGQHERTLRQFWIDSKGVHIGRPLKHFQGVLSGVPIFHGSSDELKPGK